MRFWILLALAGLCIGLATPAAQAGRNTAFGISDPAYQTNWNEMWPRIEPLHLDQVAAWVNYDCHGPSDTTLGDISKDMPVFVNFVGDISCTPTTPGARRRYAKAYLQLILANPNIKEAKVWNEPDTRHWTWSGTMLQYIKLQAVVYDMLHGRVSVLGCGFSPGGMFASHTSRRVQMTLPGYVKAVRRYFRLTRRTLPLMDGCAYNPYWGWGKAATDWAVKTMNRGWRGLPQKSPNRGLCLWWAETGLDSSTDGAPPGPYGLPRYKGKYKKWRNSGSDAMQASQGRSVLKRAQRDPRVCGMFNFLQEDEQELPRWQSGLFYFMGGPKPVYYVWLNREQLVPRRACLARVRRRIRFGGE